ncbi:MAG: ATP-dependent sacrificial sulfur transferase LarE [Magnetococcales bacterium]|nr:ATP-dependent sacrificial sulfur transferase LarE [Magnetococcales bacterium]
MANEPDSLLYAHLLQTIRACERVLVAFSGGVDSSFLLWAVRESGVPFLAVTALSPTMPAQDRQDVAQLVAAWQVAHRFIDSGEMADTHFVRNDFNRCYYCKSDLFSRLSALAEQEGFAVVVDGSTRDDAADYRPGLRAKGEHGVRSPLWEAGFGKAEVRRLAQARGLPNWDKPASPCLSSRISYGEPIVIESLRMVEAAEGVLKNLGFTTLRVRKQGQTARIELPPAEIPRLLQEPLRQQISAALRVLGFQFVTLDLEGFQSGKLNRVLAK